MKFSDSKSSVPKSRHRPAQIRSATHFHFQRLIAYRTRFCVTKDARGRRLTSRPDRVTSGDANRTRGICIRKRNSSSHQAIEVRRVNMRVAERSDRIEPLLVGHDKQDVGPGGWHCGFRRKLPRRCINLIRAFAIAFY